MSKVTAIIQARMASNRLPGKVLYPLGKELKPALQHIIERVRRAKSIDNILIVTTSNKEDSIIEKFSEKMKCWCYRGKNKHVLTNILSACREYSIETIVDITADCPLIDPKHIDIMVDVFKKNEDKITYLSNVINRTFPRGFDLQVYKAITLKIFSQAIVKDVHKNHSGWNIMVREDTDKMMNFVYKKNYSSWRLCIDEEPDWELMNCIFTHFKNNKFSTEEVIQFLEKKPAFLKINELVKQKIAGRG